MFPTGIFETRTQRMVLRVLAETNRRYTIDELAEACHRSPSTVSRALSGAERYPFLERSTVPGSKRYVYALDPSTEYGAAIRDFFAVERRRERADGAVPVGVWNLLSDLAADLGSVEGFLAGYCFGRYARGDYFVGDPVDVLALVEEGTEGAAGRTREALAEFEDADPPVEGHVQGVDPDALDGDGPPPSAVEEGPLEPADRPVELSRPG